MASLITEIVKNGNSTRKLTWSISKTLKKPTVVGNEYIFPKNLLKVEVPSTWRTEWQR